MQPPRYAAQLHRPVHCDRINESLLYYRDQCWSLCAWTVHMYSLFFPFMQRACRVPEDIGPARGKHFFENPHRYDEADSLLHHANSRSTGQVSIPSIHSLPPGYGSAKYSINNTNSNTPHSYMPGTTPPQLFTSPSFFSEH